ncbi:hypothetical protein ISS03_02725 [Patescibacteria group bacterium]|nr:hypothetical protein [Patescibacteria group bacterium]
MSTLFIYIIYFLLVSFAYACLKGAPWVPTWNGDMQRFLELADIKKGQKMYDLGCGDGRLVCIAANAGAKAVGFEISIFPYLLACFRVIFSRTPNCKIQFKNFWQVDLGDADIVYFFLMPKFYPRLKEKLEKELRVGTKVIAYSWAIEGWVPLKKSTHQNKVNMYLYEIK